MKGCLVALGVLAGLVTLVIGYLWLSFYDVHVRYRLTVEVQDRDQIKTGSSVIDVSYNIEPAWSPSQFNSFPRVVGYAPTIDLGEKGMLFLTFDNATRTPAQTIERNKHVSCLFDDIGCLPFAAYGKPSGNTEFPQKKAALRELLRQRGSRDVPFSALPELKTYREIDGQHRYLTPRPEDLAATFGPGVELKRVILQLTDDPLTPMPEMWPRWLKTNFEIEGIGYQQ